MNARLRTAALVLAMLVGLAGCAVPHPKTVDTPEQASVVGFVAVYDENGKELKPQEAPWWPMEVIADGEDLDQTPIRDVATGVVMPVHSQTYTNPWSYIWTWDRGEQGYVSVFGHMTHVQPGWHIECWFERNGVEVSGVGDGSLSSKEYRNSFPIPGTRAVGNDIDVDCIYHLRR